MKCIWKVERLTATAAEMRSWEDDRTLVLKPGNEMFDVPLPTSPSPKLLTEAERCHTGQSYAANEPVLEISDIVLCKEGIFLQIGVWHHGGDACAMMPTFATKGFLPVPLACLPQKFTEAVQEEQISYATSLEKGHVLRISVGRWASGSLAAIIEPLHHRSFYAQLGLPLKK